VPAAAKRRIALEVERPAWLDAHAHLTDAAGKRRAVSKGYLSECTIRVHDH
jgi:hypothetical protein